MKKNVLPPIGIDNFAKLIRHQNDEGHGYMWVDKSMLIKSFIGGAEEVAVITRPRRFGKTLTLSMLEYFFNDEVYGENTKGLFDGLAISKYAQAMAYQGKSKAIFLTLKGAKGRSYQEMYANLRQSIAELFDKHEDYIFSHGIKKDQKDLYRAIATSKAEEVDYRGSLLFLSKLFYQASGEKVYILLDEYDTPIHDAYVSGYYEECISFIREMFAKAFKGNPYLAKSMITGILKVGKESLFSGLNNVKIYSILTDKRYAEYFGFTEKETNGLLQQTDLPTEAKSLKEMYNGYEVNGITLYNPWSIISFIEEAKSSIPENIHEALRPHWVNTGGTHLIADLLTASLLEVEEDVSRLVQGKTITHLINESVRFNPKAKNDALSFWSVMLLAGYLKAIGKGEGEGTLKRYTLALPNEEIRLAFADIATEVSAGNLHRAGELMDVTHDLVQGNTKHFAKYLKKFLTEVASLRDTKANYKEQFFHGLILGLVGCQRRTHTIRSNREGGEGYYDICITPKDKKKNPLGVIIELKATSNDKEDLAQLARQALDQIVSKHYYQELKTQVPKVLTLGIAFNHKEVAIAKKMIPK